MHEPPGFRAFVEARYPLLVKFGTMLTGDPGHGEDLVQDALVTTLRRWSRLDLGGEGQAPEAYVRQVMTHAAWRSAKRRWWGEPPTEQLPEHAGADAYALVDTSDSVRGALAALPRSQRIVLVLRYWSGMTEAEIAAELGCSAGTVKSRAGRGVAALRTSGLLADTDNSVGGGTR